MALHDHPEDKYELINFMGYPIGAYEEMMNMMDKMITIVSDNVEKHPGEGVYEWTRNTAVTMMDTIVMLVTHAVDVRADLFKKL